MFRSKIGPGHPSILHSYSRGSSALDKSERLNYAGLIIRGSTFKMYKKSYFTYFQLWLEAILGYGNEKKNLNKRGFPEITRNKFELGLASTLVTDYLRHTGFNCRLTCCFTKRPFCLNLSNTSVQMTEVYRLKQRHPIVALSS